MYNKVKRTTSLVGGIISIVLGSFYCLFALIYFFAMFGTTCSNMYDTGIDSTVTATVVLLFIVNLGFGLALVILGGKLCKAPVYVDGKYENRKGIFITLMIISVLSFVYSIIFASAISVAGYYLGVSGLYVISYFNILESIAVLALAITSMCLPDVANNSAQIAQTVPQTVVPQTVNQPVTQEQNADQKIEKLKAWKEEGIINEEQYKEAVAKLVSTIIE